MHNKIKSDEFRTLIIKIENRIGSSGIERSSLDERLEDFNNSMILATRNMVPALRSYNKSLLLIYNYNKINEYGKIILEDSTFFIEGWTSNYKMIEIGRFNDNEFKLYATEKFIVSCKDVKNKEVMYKFIFWAMMILAVDKTDIEKNLSVICDFAAIMNVTDDEMEDIFKLIKIIFHQKEVDFQFKSTNIPNIFSRVIDLYK